MNNPSFNSESSLSSLGDIYNAQDNIEINTGVGASVFISPTKGIGKTDKDIVDISIEKLQPFRNHPFKVEYDKSMEALTASIKEEGILNPLIVRKKSDNDFEILSGHRRKGAAREAGLKELPCVIVDMNDEDALLCVVSSNEHRKKLLPSERAKSISIKYSILLKRRKLGKDEGNARTREIIAKELGISSAKVSQCLKLNDLGSSLMDMVDLGRIKETHAVNIVHQMSVPVREMIEHILWVEKDLKFDEPCLNEILAEDKAGAVTQEKFEEIVYRHESKRLEEKKEKATRRRTSVIRPDIARFFPSDYTGVQVEDAVVWLLNKHKDSIDYYLKNLTN